MTRRIDEDRSSFNDIYSGKVKKKIKEWIGSGEIVGKTGKDGKIIVKANRIRIPFIVKGDSGNGVGVGKGEEGQIVAKEPKPGEGKPNKVGEGSGDGVEIEVDVNYVLDLLQEELDLPNLKHKVSDTFEDTKIKYNSVSKTGPESLRHTRKTLRQTMKRQCATGSIDKKYKIPGCNEDIKLLLPINSDKRYRQWNEIKIPSSKAVIFFARDGSYSMDEEKCDIISDLCWWISAWVSRFYEKTEKCYIWHDYTAREVDEATFYKLRKGGGTLCSSSLDLVSKQLENRYNPLQWNIYLFYFTDGENTPSDNPQFINILKGRLGPEIVNLVGVCQVKPSRYLGSIKNVLDIEEKVESFGNLITSSIDGFSSVEELDMLKKNVIMDFLGKKNV